MVEDGSLKAEFMYVESEHSTLSACMGSSSVWARTFTAISSQGAVVHGGVLALCKRLQISHLYDECQPIADIAREHL